MRIPMLAWGIGPGIDCCERRAEGAISVSRQKRIAIARVANRFDYIDGRESRFQPRKLSGLPAAAVESRAVGAQNLNHENCFASLPRIALC